MSNSLKAIILGCGTIITAIVVGLGMFLTREASAATMSGVSQVSKINKEFADADKIMYEGLPVSGSEVINAINKFKMDDISVKVKTKKSVVYYNRLLTNDDKELGGISSASVKNTQILTSEFYINQRATFTGEVIKDVNGSTICISFTQN